MVKSSIIACEKGAAGNLEQMGINTELIRVLSLEAMHELVECEGGRLATCKEVYITISNIEVWSLETTHELVECEGGGWQLASRCT